MIDAVSLWQRAEAALRSRDFASAAALLRALLEAVDRIDFEYDGWVRAFSDCMRALGAWQELATCSAYLGVTVDPSPEVLAQQVEAARSGDLAARRGIRLYATYLSRAGHHRPASVWFAASGMPIHQGIELERAREPGEAAAIWAQLLDSGRLEAFSYESALARVNHALCLYRLGDEGSRLALAEAMTAIEELADAFEAEGRRERAFDAYQLLARLGIETSSFENIAEGYLNSVRILRDDGLRLDAVRLYEAFVTLARRASEWHAAAAILREAADYCTRVGLPYADDLRLRSAEAWQKAAAEAESAGQPVQLVENAHLAAAESYASVRAFRQVVEVYRRLARLPLPHRGAERYARLVERLGPGREDAPRPVPVPEFLKHLPEYEEVWYVDLAEHEIGEDAALVAAGIMSDRRFPDFVRRSALLLLLDLLAQPAEPQGIGRSPESLARLAAIRAYPVVSVLEKSFERADEAGRRAIVHALGNLRFKRCFGIITAALRDPSVAVREEAARSVAKLSFTHAFEPLRRIFESRDRLISEEARASAVRAIGRIHSIEAVEFLCDRVREDAEPYASVALQAIRELHHAELAPTLRRQLDQVSIEARAVFEETLSRLGRRGG